MRAMVTCLTLVFVSCGRTDLDAEPVDVGTAQAMPRFTLSAASADFVACLCHHGVGAGVDGSVRLTVNNPTSQQQTVAVEWVELRVPGRSARSSTTTVLGHRLGESRTARQVSIAPGEVDVVVEFGGLYIDIEPFDHASPLSIQVRALLSGVASELVSQRVVVR